MCVQRTVILGGGFGGLAVAYELCTRLGSTHEVVMVDRSRTFSMGLRKPWAVAGVDTLEGGARDRHRLAMPQVRFLERDVVRIVAEERRVDTDQGPLDGDFLVVALGAEYDFAATPGLLEHGNEFYTTQGALAAREALASFAGGPVVVGIAQAPYKCPPAPSEAAMKIGRAHV